MIFHETHQIREARDRLTSNDAASDELSDLIRSAQQIWPQLTDLQRKAIAEPCLGEHEDGPTLGLLELFDHNPSRTYRGRKHDNYLWIRTELGRICWVLFNTLAEGSS